MSDGKRFFGLWKSWDTCGQIYVMLPAAIVAPEFCDIVEWGGRSSCEEGLCLGRKVGVFLKLRSQENNEDLHEDPHEVLKAWTHSKCTSAHQQISEILDIFG